MIGEDRMVEGDLSFDKNFSGAVVSGGGGAISPVVLSSC